MRYVWKNKGSAFLFSLLLEYTFSSPWSDTKVVREEEKNRELLYKKELSRSKSGQATSVL